MKKYLSFFRLRFSMGLQYRAAALAGVVTQFAWGFMEIMVFRAFYRADPGAFPMSFSATASYVWLQQAFLALFAAWMMENEIFDTIVSGNVAYELCRPVGIYDMWFARNIAGRLSRAVLRCFPILAIAVFLPEPYCASGVPGVLCAVFAHRGFGAFDDGVFLYACLCAVLFYHIACGTPHPVCVGNGISGGRGDSASLFSR